MRNKFIINFTIRMIEAVLELTRWVGWNFR
jgi:hypothetical protein